MTTKKVKHQNPDGTIAEIPSSCQIGKQAHIIEPKEIGVNVKIGKNSLIRKGAEIGHRTHIGENVTIGTNVAIGNYVRIADGTHIGNNVIIGSLSNLKGRNINIGNDCFIDEYVTIDKDDIFIEAGSKLANDRVHILPIVVKQ